MESLRAENNGNVMVEYGLIGALLVLIAVPALGLLGDGLKTFYGDAGSLSNAQGLFGLMDADGEDLQVATSTGISDTLSDGLSEMETYGGPMSLSMKNGVLTLGLPNGTSAAISSTGAEGGAMSVAATSMMADQFMRLADEYEGMVGDGLIGLTRQLAGKGYALADAEQGYNDASAGTEEVYVAHWDYADTHQQLIRLIKEQPGYDADSGQFTDPKLKAFHDSLNFYGEGIDTVAVKNYLDGYERVPSNVDSGLDVDVSTITLDMAPVFTEQTSDRIALAREESRQP